MRLGALLHASADADARAVRQAGVQRRDLRRERLDDCRGLHARREVGLHRHSRQPVPAPDDRVLLAVLHGGDLAQRHGLPVRQRQLKGPDRRWRHPLLGGRPDQDVVEPDPAAHLGGGDAGHDRIHGERQLLRAETEETGLILVDPDPDRARGLHPVVVDVHRAGGGADEVGHAGGDLARLLRVPSADPVLERPSDRRPELQRGDASDGVREVHRERALELRLHPLALLEALGDHNGLGEEVVRELHVQGQIESDGALADIAAPAIDVRIALEELVQPGGGLPRRGDGGVLGQLQVDQEFGAVGCRKELLRNEAHAKERRREQGERGADRDPAGAHRKRQGS